jgi:hypothetical protein
MNYIHIRRNLKSTQIILVNVKLIHISKDHENSIINFAREATIYAANQVAYIAILVI